MAKTPEEFARIAIEQGLAEIRRHPINLVFGPGGEGPSYDMPAARVDAAREVQRIARMFPAVWDTFSDADRDNADPRHPWQAMVEDNARAGAAR